MIHVTRLVGSRYRYISLYISIVLNYTNLNSQMKLSMMMCVCLSRGLEKTAISQLNCSTTKDEKKNSGTYRCTPTHRTEETNNSQVDIETKVNFFWLTSKIGHDNFIYPEMINAKSWERATCFLLLVWSAESFTLLNSYDSVISNDNNPTKANVGSNYYDAVRAEFILFCKSENEVDEEFVVDENLGDNDDDFPITEELVDDNEVVFCDTDDDDAEQPSMASPLSQLPSEEDDNLYRGSYYRNEQWLETSTEEMLDLERVPLGSLSVDDVESIVGLMSAWVRRRSVDAALIVEQLLKRIVDDMRAQNREVHVTTRMYTIAMDAWAKCGAEGGARRAQHIHDAMVEMYEQTKDPQIAPSSISYNTLMNAWSKSSDADAATMAEKVLKKMIELSEPDVNTMDVTVAPDAVTFSTMMDAYARSNAPNATKRAVELFDLMDELGVKRNVYTFSALQNVYARSGKADAPSKTLGVLEKMLDLYSKGDIFAKPNCVNYNAVLNALSRTHTKESARLADKMLRKMELPVSEGGYDVEPDRLSYALAILAGARCRDEVYGSRTSAANLLKMEKRAEAEAQKREEISSAAPPQVTLDIECFNVVLTAIARCRQRDSVERAVEIVKRMERYATAGHEHIRPNVRSWNAIMNALSRSKEKGVGAKAERILNFLFERHKNGVRNVKPDAFSFAAVLSAYQRDDDPTAAQRADGIVRRMEELYAAGEIDTPPDVYHYTIVCASWAKSGQKAAAQRSVQILSHMMERHQRGYPDVKPNVRTYNAVLDCLSRGGEEEQAEQLLYHMLSLSKQGDKDARPDSFSFNSVINAFTRSKKRGSGERAEAILDRFLEYSEENPKSYPDSRSFTHIVSYYAKSKALDAPYRAEYMLNRMISLFKTGRKELTPNIFPFTAVMESYSSQKHPDAGICAERLLRTMYKLEKEYGIHQLKVNTGVMNCVLHAWASSGDDDAGRRAEMNLDDMERKAEAGDIDLQPNAKSYSLVLNAWTKSVSFDKAERALEILLRMKEQYNKGRIAVEPNEHAYALVVNACAFTDTGPDAQTKAFDIALKILTELEESDNIEPSSLCYGWFIQACGRLRVDDRLRVTNMVRAFTECCDRGLVNDFVLHRLKVSAEDGIFEKLISSAVSAIPADKKTKLKDRVSISQLPKEWTRKRFKKRRVSKDGQKGNFTRGTPKAVTHDTRPRIRKSRKEGVRFMSPTRNRNR